jgi:protein tyrosine/serine phosphatase
VVDLRPFHSDAEKLAGTGVDYVQVPAFTWSLGNRQVARFLTIATDPDRAPVFVHCKYGADRAGAMCAVYRIVIEGWTKDQALAEMTKGGFSFHGIWKNLVKYVDNLDVDEIKQRARLTR